MPSRKKTKGRARREKSNAPRSSPALRPVASAPRLHCTHGYPQIPEGHICQSFLDDFNAAWREELGNYKSDIFDPELTRRKGGRRGGIVQVEGPCYRAVIDIDAMHPRKYSGVYNNGDHRRLLKAALLSLGTDFILQGSCSIARTVAPGAEGLVLGGIATIIIMLEERGGEVGPPKDDKERIMKERDIMMGCQRSLIELYHDGIPCGCLGEAYRTVQSQPRTAVCGKCFVRKERSALMMCSRCSTEQYCSRSCQESHWLKHKQHCKEFSKEKKACRATGAELSKVLRELEDDANREATTLMTLMNNDSDGTFWDHEIDWHGQPDERFAVAVSGELNQMAASHDDLFANPPPKEQCALCCHPMPIAAATYSMESVYQLCCGRRICIGCVHVENEAMLTQNRAHRCPICATTLPSSHGGLLQRCLQRMKADDGQAFVVLAFAYKNGNYGLEKDRMNAVRLLLRASKIGSLEANQLLGDVYWRGNEVAKMTDDEQTIKGEIKQALDHLRQAAVGGHCEARHELGLLENRFGTAKRAVKHFTIAASAGWEESLKYVEDGFRKEYVTKEEYKSVLYAYKDSHDELTTKQRTDAASANVAAKRGEATVTPTWIK